LSCRCLVKARRHDLPQLREGNQAHAEQAAGLLLSTLPLTVCGAGAKGDAMKPYYEHGGITIYHGDCRDVIAEWCPIHGMPPLFDLMLTDPPYGHGEKWSGGTWASNPIYARAFQWDAQPASPDTIATVLRLAHASIIWGGNYYRMEPSRCWLAWVKTSRMPTMADFELAWTDIDKPSKLYMANRNADGRREHPTQKPVDLMKWCIAQVPGVRTIVDPFMGSGTTLRAAKDSGLSAIGIDRDEHYCEIAARRLQQETLALDGEVTL